MKKIAIDIDNTICETSTFLGVLAEKFDKEVLHQNNKMDYSKIVPISENWTKEDLDNFTENYCNKEAINIKPIEGAAKYINMLKDEGYEILFITGRGYRKEDKTDLIVKEYLDRNNFHYDNVITRVNDKCPYIEEYDYFIDDEPFNCEEALKRTNAKVIMISSYRTKYYSNKNIKIVNNWEEIYEYIKTNK